ncbi:MAG: Mth938-like domain-containing protein [Beijerinckiaceae bacterium]|nr:Mth938-like domain-containing protein [Beijerinckiaceae bacterium]
MERSQIGAKYDGFLPGRHLIEGYGSGGFSFGGMTHRGSIFATPSGIHAFGATDILLVNELALAPLFAEPAGAVNLLVVGTGLSFVLPPRALRDLLKARGVGVDPMATAHAVATYNILLGESRPVAALLLAAP